MGEVCLSPAMNLVLITQAAVVVDFDYNERATLEFFRMTNY
jgi:hypothetical protein